MPYLNRLRSGTLLYLRLMVVAFGLICGNIGLELLYNGSSFLFWLPLALLSIFLLVLPLLIKQELDRRPLEERQFTLKQIYAGMGLAHLAIILAGIYRLLTVRDAEWRLIIIVVIVLDICLLAFLTPRVLKVIKQSERG
ncbi:hypothetical protein [Streptococcus salivarius]|jgi:Na+/H+ antiporter NhaA|uniref:hypothetical protein n=1 Tax=Streptococcus salivarius TaxID=1304 RepID=UPI000AF94DDC|nr:hypothetical protein [Streptococcus salivarius]